MRYLLGILVTLLAVSSYVYLQEAPFLYLLGILIIVVHAFFFHDPKRQKPECLSQMPGYILLLLLIVGVRYANPSTEYLAISGQTVKVVQSKWWGLKMQFLDTRLNDDGELLYHVGSKWKRWEGPQGFFEGPAEGEDF